MTREERFRKVIEEGYRFEGDSIVLGTAVLDGRPLEKALVRLPLATFNRHGLIAGATGTGKTKTLQILAEHLSRKGVPSLVMDIKGDLSGIAVPGNPHPKIDERHQYIGIPWEAAGTPVEFLSLSDEPGVRLRATVSEFGPVLFSKILGLNEVQEGIVAVIFKYADDKNLPLIDLKDFKKLLQHLMSDEGKAEITAQYGTFSAVSAGTILRKVIELEAQGAERFFGEPSFDVQDLLRTRDGKGIVHILRVSDIQDRPKLFSTFMLQLLAEVYATFPEEGDLEKPKLMLFIDEAHLLFEEATKALLNQIEVVVKLIRSKGVGLIFITQNPVDIPEEVLAQLGLKIQHALRAFTAKDRKAIKLAAENYPETDFYTVDEVITELGIGEALVTALDEKGRPTPLVHTLLRAPMSRMDVLTDEEIQQILSQSELIPKYNTPIDRKSAYEILSQKLDEACSEEHMSERERDWKAAEEIEERKSSPTLVETILKSTLVRQIGRTVAREVTRGILGVLGLRPTRRRRSYRRRRR